MTYLDYCSWVFNELTLYLCDSKFYYRNINFQTGLFTIGIMSTPKENKPTKFEGNRCPLSMVAANSKAIIEPQIGQDGVSMLSLAAITLVGKLFDGTNTEEMYTSFKKILNGKCQKQNSSEFLALWRSIQSKIDKLSVCRLLYM